MTEHRADRPAMSIDECLDFAGEWSHGMTFHAGSQGWRVVCMLLAEEVRAMREKIAQLERGEYICKSCGLRTDGEGPKGDF